MGLFFLVYVYYLLTNYNRTFMLNKSLIVIALLVGAFTAEAQILKDVYKDFLKYGTVYAAGDISNSIEAAEPTYFLRTNQDGSIYSIPDVVTTELNHS